MEDGCMIVRKEPSGLMPHQREILSIGFRQPNKISRFESSDFVVGAANQLRALSESKSGEVWNKLGD